MQRIANLAINVERIASLPINVQRITNLPINVKRIAWWSTSARAFLEGPVARCQGLLDPGRDPKLLSLGSLRWFWTIVNSYRPWSCVTHSCQWWFGFSYGQSHPTIGDTVNARIRHPEYKASYTGRIATLPINVQLIATLPIKLMCPELPPCPIKLMCNELPSCQ